MASEERQKVQGKYRYVNSKILFGCEGSLRSHSGVAGSEEASESMQMDFDWAERAKHAAEDGLEESASALPAANPFLRKQEAIHLQGGAQL